MRRSTIKYVELIAIAVISLVLCISARLINSIKELDILADIYCITTFVSLISFILVILVFLIENKAYRGIKYFYYYFTIKNRLELQMMDAGYSIKRSNYVELPRIKLVFSNDFKSATLRIQNSMKFSKKLDDVDISSALGKFVDEYHYHTDDCNTYVYELVDASVSFKQTFNSFEKFKEYSATLSDYKLFLDNRSAVKLQHTLIVGQTGSGKTYCLYSLVLQMLSKKAKYELYFSDPKGSSLAVLGSVIASSSTYIDNAEIIAGLEQFVDKMRIRKTELKERLKEKLDADYSDFNMSPHIFIIDEYASFSSTLASCEKKVRDNVKSMLYEIILQGRQLGFFVFLIMQKSDATLIDTALRENLPLKIVLGNSDQQTYVTCFGSGVDIPNRHYAVGEGVFTEPTLAPSPKLLQCPCLNFDILGCVKKPPLCNNGG